MEFKVVSDKAIVPLVNNIDWRLDICLFSFFHKHAVFSSLLSIILCVVLISWEKWLQLIHTQGKWGKKPRNSAFYQITE